MTLEQVFSITGREVISLVGGGGKTTLMYSLGTELSTSRLGIVLTTTTKILEPKPCPLFLQFLSDELANVKNWVKENIIHRRCLLIARKRLSSGKLEGIPPEWIEELFDTDGISTIINEADGSAGRPLKALREGEPVIPKNTTLLVPVMGIDGMDRPLSEEWVFRSSIASRLLNLPMGSTVTAEVIARLMADQVKNHPPAARVVPLINKIDIPGGLDKARKLAHYILSHDPPIIRKVVLGQLKRSVAVKLIMQPDQRRPAVTTPDCMADD